MSTSRLALVRQLGAARRAVRGHHELALGAVAQVDHRADDLGDDVARLAQHHGVADEHALAPHLLRVVQRRHLDRRPRDRTGSIRPNGVTRPVRPTFTWMSSSRVVTSSGGYFQAIAQRGARLVAPRRRWTATSSTLTTTPSISWSTSWRCSPYQATYSSTSPSVATTRYRSLTGRPQRPSSAYVPDCVCGTGPLRAPRPCTSSRSGRRALTRGSFCRSDPAAALRGFANGALPASTRRGVQRREPLDREEDLAPDLEPVRVPSPREHVRDTVDGAHVQRDVLPGAPVAPRRRPDQPAVARTAGSRRGRRSSARTGSAPRPRARARSPARPTSPAPRARTRCPG